MRTNPLLLGILAALSACSSDKEFETGGCVDVPEDATTCAAADEVDRSQIRLVDVCDVDIVGVHDDGKVTPNAGQLGVTPACC